MNICTTFVDMEENNGEGDDDLDEAMEEAEQKQEELEEGEGGEAQSAPRGVLRRRAGRGRRSALLSGAQVAAAC